MKRMATKALIIVTLCLFAGLAGIAYAGPMEQDIDQEMKQDFSRPSDQSTESGQATQQEKDSQSGQGTDQHNGSSQRENAPSDN